MTALKSRKVFIIWMTLPLFMRAEAVKTIVNIDTFGVSDKAIVIAQGDFTVGNIKQLVEEFLANHSSRNRLSRLTIGVDPRETALSLAPPGAFDVPGPPSLRVLVDQLGWPRAPIARVIALGGTAVLSIRDSAGLDEKIIGSNDPTLLTVDGKHFRLLHFRTQAPSSFLANTPLPLTLFFVSKDLFTVEDCRHLTQQMAKLTGRSTLNVNVRSDGWFNSPDYPAVFRFANLGAVPNPAEYDAAPYVFCLAKPTDVECFSRNLRK